MYGVLFSALLLLTGALLLSTWHVVKTEQFVDASGSDISGTKLGDNATEYLANLLNTVFPKLKFSASTDPTTEPDPSDSELVRQYLRNDMAKLMKEEVLQLRQLVPVPTCASGGVSPSLAQGLESAAKPL